MEKNRNVPKFPTYRGFPFILTPLIEVILYGKHFVSDTKLIMSRTFSGQKEGERKFVFDFLISLICIYI